MQDRVDKPRKMSQQPQSEKNTKSITSNQLEKVAPKVAKHSNQTTQKELNKFDLIVNKLISNMNTATESSTKKPNEFRYKSDKKLIEVNLLLKDNITQKNKKSK